jgi:prepilin-type processing-associated H-X9-DG protein
MADWPASYHGNACGFSFADGHSEIHKWLDGRTMLVLKENQTLPLTTSLPGSLDVRWLAQHALGAGAYP